MNNNNNPNTFIVSNGTKPVPQKLLLREGKTVTIAPPSLSSLSSYSNEFPSLPSSSVVVPSSAPSTISTVKPNTNGMNNNPRTIPLSIPPPLPPSNGPTNTYIHGPETNSNRSSKITSPRPLLNATINPSTNTNTQTSNTHTNTRHNASPNSNNNNDSSKGKVPPQQPKNTNSTLILSTTAPSFIPNTNTTNNSNNQSNSNNNNKKMNYPSSTVPSTVVPSSSASKKKNRPQPSQNITLDSLLTPALNILEHEKDQQILAKQQQLQRIEQQQQQQQQKQKQKLQEQLKASSSTAPAGNANNSSANNKGSLNASSTSSNSGTSKTITAKSETVVPATTGISPPLPPSPIVPKLTSKTTPTVSYAQMLSKSAPIPSISTPSTNTLKHRKGILFGRSIEMSGYATMINAPKSRTSTIENPNPTTAWPILPLSAPLPKRNDTTASTETVPNEDEEIDTDGTDEEESNTASNTNSSNNPPLPQQTAPTSTVQGTTRKKLNAVKEMMSLVKKAALYKDPDAIAELVKVLQPSDLALLRLMAYKYERRVAKVVGDQNTSNLLGTPLPGSKTKKVNSTKNNNGGISVSLTGGGIRVSNATPIPGVISNSKNNSSILSSSSTSTKGNALLGLESAIESGMKYHIANEKEKVRQQRLANMTNSNNPNHAFVPSIPSSSAKPNPSSETTGASPKPLTKLLRQLHRQKAVRSWVFTSLQAKLKDATAAAARTTQVHADLLRNSKTGKKSNVGKVIPSMLNSVVAPVDKTATKGKFNVVSGSNIGATVNPSPNGHNVINPTGTSTTVNTTNNNNPLPVKKPIRRLTRLKKILLQERIDRWLQASDPQVVDIYKQQREEHVVAKTAENDAEVKARKELRKAAVAVIHKQEAKKIRKKINNGKIILPSIRVPGGNNGRLRLTTVDPKEYAAALASKIKISRRRIQRFALKLIADGKMKDPVVVGKEAKEAAIVKLRNEQLLHRQQGNKDTILADTHKEENNPGSNTVPNDEIIVVESTTPLDTKQQPAHLSKDSVTHQAKVQGAHSALALATKLAHMDITQSTKKIIITKAIPKLPAGSLVPTANVINPRRVQVRNYVEQDLSPQLDTMCSEMLSTAYFYQERARIEDPRKAMRRIVIGLREVNRGCRTGRIKLIIVAPNIDQSDAEGGLDERVHEILESAEKNKVPVVFALSRKKIATALGTTLRCSIVGFYTFENLRGIHNQVIDLSNNLRLQYQQRIKNSNTIDETKDNGSSSSSSSSSNNIDNSVVPSSSLVPVNDTSTSSTTTTTSATKKGKSLKKNKLSEESTGSIDKSVVAATNSIIATTLSPVSTMNSTVGTVDAAGTTLNTSSAIATTPSMNIGNRPMLSASSSTNLIHLNAQAAEWVPSFGITN